MDDADGCYSLEELQQHYAPQDTELAHALLDSSGVPAHPSADPADGLGETDNPFALSNGSTV